MATKSELRPESDRSDDEKVIGGTVLSADDHSTDLLPDPDAHLSAEERARIVSKLLQRIGALLTVSRIVSWSGSST